MLPSWFALPVAIALALLSFGLALRVEIEEREQIREHVQVEAHQLAGDIERHVGMHMQSLERGALRWEQAAGMPKSEFEFYAETFHREVPEVVSVNWIDAGGFARWPTSLLDGRAISEPERLAVLRQARDRRDEVVASGPFEMDDRRVFSAARSLSAGGRFDGHLEMIFDYESLFDRKAARLVARGYQFVVADGRETVFAPAETPRGGERQFMENAVANIAQRPWRIELWPGETRLRAVDWDMPGAVLGSGLLLSALVLITLWLAEYARRQALRVTGANRRLREEVAQRLATEAQHTELIYNLRRLVGSVPQGICSLDDQGRIDFVNGSLTRMTGWPEREQLGMAHEELLHHEARCGAPPAAECAVLRTLRTGEVVHREDGRLWRRDGSRCPVEYMCMPLRDHDRKIVGAVCSFSDISKRKQAERELIDRQRQLESINAELKSFSYSVSHDLRAPLRAIDGFARILTEDFSEPLGAEGRRLLEVIRRNVDKMSRLIEDLLTLARRGKQALRHERVDMKTLASSALQDALADESERDIRAEIGELPEAWGDPSLLREVWNNLLQNAVKYTRGVSPAVIEVSGATAEGGVVYSVRDNGAGFDMAYADKLFQVFQRLHSEAEFEGTGIGLAIVQRIVTRHNGRAWAEGRPGAGATFSFEIPFAPDHEEPRRR